MGETQTVRAAAPPVFGNVLEMIGSTPMLELKNLDTGPCRLFGKLELLNPAQSIKDRIGLRMIADAEADGRLDPNGDPRPTIIEATAGNTGLALALVAGQRGYKIKVVVPDKMSAEKIQHLKAMGADVVMARSDVEKGHPEYYQDVAARIARETPNSVYINQFENPSNVAAHRDTTGPEAWAQITEHVGGKVDAIVVGVGSGGTLSGMGGYLREQNPDLKIVLADPAESILNPLVNENKRVKPGSWMIEGMGEDFVPSICDLDLCDEAVPVTDEEAFIAARELLRLEGVLSGSSTGCLIHAASVWCREQTEPLNVVTLLCDSGAKYLSKMFNDFWMMDQGFLPREPHGDLRDLIARRHLWREDVTLDSDAPLAQAIRRMELYAVSQMAVMDHRDKLVGIIDESDILLAVQKRESAFGEPVSGFMTTRLETVRPTDPIESLTPIFRADRVAIVADEDGTYYGLITKIDLIEFLRRRMK